MNGTRIWLTLTASIAVPVAVASPAAAQSTGSTSVGGILRNSPLGSLGKVADPVKPLLAQASDRALDQLAQPGAFYADTAVRIVLPGATGRTARKLIAASDRLGVTTKLTKALNDAAGLAANAAKPTFRAAIDGLRPGDIPGIIAQRDGATTYLERSAGQALGLQVRPLVEGALIQVGAFDQLERIQKSGGALLGVVGLDRRRLTDSVTDQAMKGIFAYMAREEGKVRDDPLGTLGKVLQR